MRAWLFQDPRQKKRLGDAAPWSVGWIDPDGKRKSKRVGTESNAQKYLRKIEGQLAAGTYQLASRKQWKEFRKEYERRILDGAVPGTRRATKVALDQFQKLVKPGRVNSIKTQTIDDFIAKRRRSRGAKKGSTISPATINRDLRHIKAVLRIAQEWGHLAVVPKIRMVRELKKVPQYVTPEHFAAIYTNCTAATRPACSNYPVADWWRGFLMTAYMTGWRVDDLLRLRRDNVDLDAGIATLEAGDTKAKRGERVPLHPVVVDHLRKLTGFDVLLFPIDADRRFLWDQFGDIQRAAGVHLTCHDDHEHTAWCHVYGFHDLRRAFATMNAERLSADALQSLMRHKSYTTTQRYVNMARQLNAVVADLYVPDTTRKAN